LIYRAVIEQFQQTLFMFRELIASLSSRQTGTLSAIDILAFLNHLSESSVQFGS
jgi:hypothetical protein